MVPRPDNVRKLDSCARVAVAALVTVIAVAGAVRPAGADELVSNFGLTDFALDDHPLSTHALAQSFTTGSNATGYQMTSGFPELRGRHQSRQ